jgi:site-specific recombinase XerD
MVFKGGDPMNEYFSRPFATRKYHEGPLGEFADAFSAQMYKQGYALASARLRTRLVSDFSRWLERNGCEARDVSPEGISQYLQYRYRGQHFRPRQGDSKTLYRLLGLLQQSGIIACPAPTRIKTIQDGILDDYRTYLLEVRALSIETVENYAPFARLLLTERFPGNRIDFSRLCIDDITGFVKRHAPRYSRKRALIITAALRSFLRFLHHRGDVHADLAACVPSLPSWSLSDVPKYLHPLQVQRILDHCDRRGPVGRRDYAILLLLARLGLRAGEVASLKLEHINWEAGYITVRGKGGRSDLLPMPPDVGEAIAAYLQNGRPSCSSRFVFVRVDAPRTGFSHSTAIGSLVRRALARAQVDSSPKGAHLLRHTLATQMLQQGATLAEIGEILRHRSPNTTAIYAKVNLPALRTIALPWPGGAR